MKAWVCKKNTEQPEEAKRWINLILAAQDNSNNASTVIFVKNKIHDNMIAKDQEVKWNLSVTMSHRCPRNGKVSAMRPKEWNNKKLNSPKKYKKGWGEKRNRKAEQYVRFKPM